MFDGITQRAMVDKFLRTYEDVFSAEDMSVLFAEAGIKMSAEQWVDYLESCPLVFPLESGLYVTRSGAFTSRIFCIKPTLDEYNRQVLIPGSRCMPFVDSEILPEHFSFYFRNKKLSRKVESFDSDNAIDFFIMYGEEYAPQCIALDSANRDLNLVDRGFELPNRVNLTGVDISPLIKQGLAPGGRILCSVTDWDKCRISVVALNDGEGIFGEGAFAKKRQKWYAVLEKCFEQSFERMGPCSSIEEQLSTVFFENLESLCVPACGSVEEFINSRSEKIGFQNFGVETRLWYKGQDVPAVGTWNSGELDSIKNAVDNMFDSEKVFRVSQDVFTQYVLDMLFMRKDDLEELVKRIYPKDYVFRDDEKKVLIAQAREIKNNLVPGYNWFADHVYGEVRNQSLRLLSRINDLVYRIDYRKEVLENFPQQEMVILTQLYSHLMRIVSAISNGENISDEVPAILASIEGMAWNFEDIRDVIEYAIRAERMRLFRVVK